jgi:hypothetical protein
MSRVWIVVCLVASVTAACRMADGPLPNPKADEVPNQLGDLGRDLSGVVNGDVQARQDFVDDMMAFVDLEQAPDAEAPVKQLAGQVIDAVVVTKAQESAVAPLLEHLYVAIRARELSENQVKTLEENVQTAASRMGVDDVKARALAAQAGIVQQAVTDRHRRWYEVF